MNHCGSFDSVIDWFCDYFSSFRLWEGVNNIENGHWSYLLFRNWWVQQLHGCPHKGITRAELCSTSMADYLQTQLWKTGGWFFSFDKRWKSRFFYSLLPDAAEQEVLHCWGSFFFLCSTLKLQNINELEKDVLL